MRGEIANQPNGVEKSGREISGLESKQEKFSTLVEGRDYQIVEKNKNVHCAQPLQDFFVFVNPNIGTENRTINPPHWRTITQDNVPSKVMARKIEGGKFVDKEAPFYAVNTKGVGYLKPTIKGESLESYDTWTKPDEPAHDFGYKMLGLASRSEFVPLQIMSESQFLIEKGLRAEVYWGIARLKNVYYKGKLTSIDELRQQGVIIKRKDYQPHMAVRLLKNNDRIEEARYADDRRSDIFQKAFQIFNQEIQDSGLDILPVDIAKTEDQKRFFEEFFQRMGRNMAVLLNVGYSHFHLHSSNITLAAEIADLGTASDWRGEKNIPAISKEYNGVRRAHIKDMRDIVHALKRLRAAAKLAGLKTGEPEDLKIAFMRGFDSALQVERVQKIQKTNATAARKWQEAIFQAIIIDKKRLTALYHEQASDEEIDDSLTIIEREWNIHIN